jgi:choline dehydrogenase-like flavoprotein
VVNSNLKVYGLENLFIAGSSVFTTAGHNNPTLPIVQFSLRLAEYLNK